MMTAVVVAALVWVAVAWVRHESRRMEEESRVWWAIHYGWDTTGRCPLPTYRGGEQVGSVPDRVVRRIARYTAGHRRGRG